MNRLAEAAAVAALDDEEHARRTRELNASGIEYLTRELGALGLRRGSDGRQLHPRSLRCRSHSERRGDLIRSDANTHRSGADVYDKLLREGVIVRPMAGFGLTDCVRITVGLPEENERVVKALLKVQEASS